jgi:hypothetical protein
MLCPNCDTELDGLHCPDCHRSWSSKLEVYDETAGAIIADCQRLAPATDDKLTRAEYLANVAKYCKLSDNFVNEVRNG